MITTQTQFIAAGGNRNPSGADWHGKQLVYASGHNIAIWKPQQDPQPGVTTLLSGHTDVVNAVKQLSLPHTDRPVIISAAADKTVRLWRSSNGQYQEAVCLTDHQASINTISVVDGLDIFVTGAADATVKIWKITESSNAVEAHDHGSSNGKTSNVGDGTSERRGPYS